MRAFSYGACFCFLLWVGAVLGQEKKEEKKVQAADVDVRIDGFYPAGDGAVGFQKYKDGEPDGDSFLRPIPAHFAARLNLALQEYWRVLNLAKTHADELELSKQQLKLIAENERSLGKRMLEIAPRLSGSGDPDVLVDEMLAAFDSFKTEIFLKHQIKRIDEIQVQEDLCQGTAFSLAAKYRDELGITEEQKASLLKRKNELEEKFFADVSQLLKKQEAKLLQPLDPNKRKEVQDALKILPRNEDISNPNIREQMRFILGL